MKCVFKERFATTRFLLIAPLILATILFTITIFYLAVPHEKKQLIIQKKRIVEELTRSAWYSLDHFNSLAEDGTITRDKAMESARKHIRALRYGEDNNDYFWIINTEHVCIVNPFSPELEGKNLNELKDTKGKYFIREFVNTAVSNKAGFVDYSWKWKDVPETSEQKTSYVMLYEPWGWVIGTGYYEKEMSSEFKSVVGSILIIGLTITVISVVLSICVVVQCVIGDNRRRQTESLLKESEKKYSSLVETTGTGWVILDEKGTILDANGEYLRLKGVNNLSDVAGKTVHEVTSPENAKRNQPFIQRCLEEGHARGVELEFESQDGSITPVEINASVEKTESGRRILALCRDISERKTKEKEATQLAAAINEVAESIVITDPKGIITYVNPWFLKMTGYTREEAIGQDTSILSDGSHSDKFYEDLWQTISSGKTWRGHFKNKKKDGTLFEEDAVISPVHDSNGAIISYVAVKHDITQEQLLEHQIRRSQKMAAIGQLAHKVAHDFTNVLTMVLGNAQLAKKENEDNPELQQQMDDIIYAGNKTALLTTELLAFAHPTKLSLKSVKLNKIVEGVEEILRQSMPKNVEIEITNSSNVSIVEVDPTQIEQVLVHMAINSAEAMPEGGKLTIETRPCDPDDGEVIRLQAYAREVHGKTKDFAMVVINDTGTGISPEIAARIFDPFFSTKKSDKNTGLGLSTAYKILEQHGGFITMSSNPATGTTFRIYLPLAEK